MQIVNENRDALNEGVKSKIMNMVINTFTAGFTPGQDRLITCSGSQCVKRNVEDIASFETEFD